MYKRVINLPIQKPQGDSFFLWGPRQTGKTSLLRATYPHALMINLLNTEIFIKYSQRPALLREELRLSKEPFVIIDEVQKIPILLDEVHLLIEEDKIQFGLCGSSARKVRRGHANLLGGRALRYVLHGISAYELGSEFEVDTILNRGYLPKIYTSRNYKKLWKSYVVDYLKEEIAAEGLVRNLPAFSSFLNAAALSDTEILSYKPFARDTGVSQTTVKDYFQILEDTLIGFTLPAYREKPKRRIVQAPKFYFFDVGLVNVLAKRGEIVLGSPLIGKAFENWVHHELRCYLDYAERDEELSYWRLSTGVEVDFIVGSLECAIEAKGSEDIHADHLKGLRELARDYSQIGTRVVVSLSKVSRKTEDGILILTPRDFIQRLWNGKLF